MKRCLIIVLLLVAFISCKKESNTKYCWQLIDAQGNYLQVECDKTEDELKAWLPAHCNTCTYKKQ